MLILDALREGLRAAMWVTLGALGLVLLLAPAAGGVVIGARMRATTDLVLWLQWVSVCGTALHLGTRVPGPAGLRALVLAGPVSRARWVAARTLGLGAVSWAQVVALLVAGAVVVPPAPVWGLHGLALGTEALVLIGMAGLLRTLGARPWLAGVAAGALGLVGHLEAEVVRALGQGGLAGLGRGLTWLLPGFDQVGVQSAIVAGQGVVLTTVLGGAAQLLCWSLVLGGATVLVMDRRDPA